MNAQKELIEHIGDREVKRVHITVDHYQNKTTRTIAGTLAEVLPWLDFEYDDGYGDQELFGNIWYADGTWSDRGEYDGAEWWEYWEHQGKSDIPNVEAETSEYVTVAVGGETVGDTLARLGKLLVAVEVDDQGSTIDDWKGWLADAGKRLNSIGT